MSGNGGLSGDNKKLDDAAGGAFEALVDWEASVSQDAVQDEVNDEMKNRTSEIRNLRRQNPKNTVYVHVFAMIEKNMAEGPKMWRFGSIIVSLSRHANAGMIPGSGKVFHKIIVLPPLADSAPPGPALNAPAWEARYDGAFMNALVTQGSAEAALAVLNGSSMYDLLRMLRKLALDGKYFNYLYGLAGSAGNSRLLVAFAAVMAAWKSADALTILQERMGDLARLPIEQQKDVLDFIGGNSPGGDPVGIAGKWRVRVGKWTWIYTFDSKGNVSWLDQGNGRHGSGRWKADGKAIKTTWYNSKTVEHWDVPIITAGQTGKATMAEGIFDLAAEKL